MLRRAARRLCRPLGDSRRVRTCRPGAVARSNACPGRRQRLARRVDEERGSALLCHGVCSACPDARPPRRAAARPAPPRRALPGRWRAGPADPALVQEHAGGRQRPRRAQLVARGPGAPHRCRPIQPDRSGHARGVGEHCQVGRLAGCAGVRDAGAVDRRRTSTRSLGGPGACQLACCRGRRLLPGLRAHASRPCLAPDDVARPALHPALAIGRVPGIPGVGCTRSSSASAGPFPQDHA